MKNKWEKLKLLVLTALFISTFIGCNASVKDGLDIEGKDELNADEIFVKTVHDFEGQNVMQLTEAEDENFLVYTEAVIPLQTGEKQNLLESYDESTNTYVFLNADDTLKGMEEGDVFFAEPSAENPSGFAVKVKNIMVEADKVEVISAPVALEDLFVYADVDALISPENVFFDETQLTDGMSIQVEQYTSSEDGIVNVSPVSQKVLGKVLGLELTELSAESHATCQGDSLNVSSSELVSQNVSVSATASKKEENKDSFEWVGASNMRISFQQNLDLSVGKSSSLGGGAASGNVHLKGSVGYAIYNIRVQFKFSCEDKFFYAGVSSETEELFDMSVEFEGTWKNGRGGMGQTWPMFVIAIPGTPIKVGGELFQLTTLSGSMKGTFQRMTSGEYGFSNTIINLNAEEPQPYKAVKSENCQAKMELEGSIDAGFGLRLDIGIPFIVDVYLENSVGGRIVGKRQLIQMEYEDIDSIHDCEKCIDGDIEVYYQLSCGADARLISAITGYDLNLRHDLVKSDMKIGDFYASYRTGEDGGVECGMGECPYNRWKVEITVHNDKGNRAAGARVTATYPDGRTDSKTTGENGMVVLYLPDGDNLLEAYGGGQRGSTHAVVTGAPATANIKMEDKREIFVSYRFMDIEDESYGAGNSCTEFSEVYSLISKKYPDAVWINSVEWGNYISGITISNYSTEKLEEAYGVSPGDIVIYVYSSKGSDRQCLIYNTYQSIVCGYEYFSMVVGIVVQPPDIEEGEDDSSGWENMNVAGDDAEPCVVWFYEMMAHPYTSIESRDLTWWLARAYIECGERIWQGLEYDNEFKVKSIGSQWLVNEWEDSAPTGGATTEYAFWANGLYASAIAQYAARAFPYIDLMWENDWTDGLNELTGEQPAA